VSKQAVELFEKGNLFADSKNPKIVKTKKKVEVERKITNEIDVNLLITTVAIKNYSGFFLVGFPPRNRPSVDYKQSMERLKQVLQARRNMKFIKRITDFHLLLFLTDYLSLSVSFQYFFELNL
jgi:nuclear protein localization family protein 4